MSNQTDGHHLTIVRRGDGEHFDVAGAKLTWKVKAEDTGRRFGFFEQVLFPGDAVPLHLHHYTETFYILAGTVIFFGEPGDKPVFRAEAGDVVVARPTGIHGFANQGEEEARLLSISVPEHQLFFDTIAEADREQPFAAMTPESAMLRVAEIGSRTDSVFLPRR